MDGAWRHRFIKKNSRSWWKIRFDPEVNFEWGQNPPDPEMSHENYSIRWTGYLKAPRPGVYKLAAIADDWMRVKLDGEVALERYADGRVSFPREKMVTLTSEPQPIEIEFVQHSGPAYAVLRWLPPGHVTEEAIPPAAFFHDKRLAQTTVVPNTPDRLDNKHGLAGEIFDDMNLKHLVKTRLDPQIDFFWGLDPPVTGMGFEHWSARWDGSLVPPTAGEYKLAVVVDDGARLWIDDSLKIDSCAIKRRADTRRPLNWTRSRIACDWNSFKMDIPPSAVCYGSGPAQRMKKRSPIPRSFRPRPTSIPSLPVNRNIRLQRPPNKSKSASRSTSSRNRRTQGISKTAKAQEMYRLADESKGSPAERFTLLLKGARYAAVAGDLNLAWPGADALEAEYQIDSLALRKELLDKAVAPSLRRRKRSLWSPRPNSRRARPLPPTALIWRWR